MEPAKEKINVRLIDGTNKEVTIKKYLPYPKVQELMTKMAEGTNFDKNTPSVEGAQAIGIMGDLANAVWCDQETKIDDVEGGSLYGKLAERFQRFLGDTGYSAEAGNSDSGTQRENDQSVNK